MCIDIRPHSAIAMLVKHLTFSLDGLIISEEICRFFGSE